MCNRWRPRQRTSPARFPGCGLRACASGSAERPGDCRRRLGNKNRDTMRSIISRLTLAAAALLMGATPMGIAARAEDAPVFTITIKDHKFDPAELHVPAGKPVTLLVKNADPTAEEFESSALKVEKLIPGGQQGTIRLRLLPAGNYSIVGEFHEDTAKGRVIAE